MTAIPASSVSVRTMADGTLRLSLDIEPRHARDAFALFGMPGAPVALAALKVGTEIPEPAKPKGGELARLAGRLCAVPKFQEWIKAISTEDAAEMIRYICDIKSRSELDNNTAAASRFHGRIRKPWAVYCKDKGWVE